MYFSSYFWRVRLHVWACARVHHNLFFVMIVRIENAEFQSILIGGIISS
jgi:hypothetical protein